MIYLILAIIILSLACVISINANISHRERIKEKDLIIHNLENHLKTNLEYEKKEEDIEEKYNEQEQKINNNDSVITDGVMPIESKKARNYNFNERHSHSDTNGVKS